MESLVLRLRAVPLFSDLPRELLARLVGELEEVRAPAGTVVVVQGEPGDAIYLVVSGTMEVRAEVAGHGERLAVFGPGDWFGEMALLTGDPRSATVVALTDSGLLRLGKDRFLALSERHPAILREITRVVCRRLARTSEDMASARRASAEVFESVLDACDPRERALLLRAALAEAPDPAVLAALPGCADARERLAALAGRHPKLLLEEGGRYALHPHFRECLLERLHREDGAEFITSLHAALAAIYEARGDRREAAVHWLGAGNWTEAIRLLRELVGSPPTPEDRDLGAWLARLPDPFLLSDPELVRAKAGLLTRQGQGDAAIALYRRALASRTITPVTREALLRGLADLYFAQGDVPQALACLREQQVGEAPVSVALHEAMAARHLAEGRGTNAYAWARSARALARGLREPMASPLRRGLLSSGWRAAAIAAAAAGLVLALPPAGLSVQAVRFLAILMAATVLWLSGRPPDYVVALGMGIAWVLLGVAPAQAAFSGFGSSTWLLMLGVLGLAAALSRSGLLYRITLLVMRRFPPTFAGQALALGTAGILTTLIVPSVQARIALIGPLLVGLSDALGYSPRSRGSAGLALASLAGFSLATTLFLTGTGTCVLAWSMLPEATRGEITWGRWLVGVIPLEALTFLGTFGAIVWHYQPREAPKARSGLVDAQLEALGPPSRAEWTTVIVAAALVLGWLTQPLHRVDPTWIALLGFCVLMAAGVLGRAALRAELDWPFLIFMGMVFSLADLTRRVGADVWFGRSVEDAFGALTHPAVAVALAVLITIGVRFFLPWQTAVPLLTVALTPFAQAAGMSPWIIALVALKAGNVFLLPYQNSYYLTLYYGTEERAFTHAQARPLAWLYAGIVLAAFLLSLPYWRALALA